MAFFPDVPSIKFEGPESRNPLAFRHYNPDEVVEGKSMKDHLRFAVCYWHTFRGTGSDPFGPGCAVRPWEDGTDSVDMAAKRVRVAFELIEKLGCPFYCFHDRDVAPEGKNLAETNKNLDAVVKVMKEEQQRTGVQLLWGTANLFSNKRFVHGASTSANADTFAYAGAQVKKALEVSKELGGVNYVFWGGREGYVTLWNTDLKRELDHFAKFLHMAVDYKKKIGFTGVFLIEPKPHEPTSHQYDFDCANSLAFLRGYGLDKEFKFNVETNHATLAKHTMHELQYASVNGCRRIDANPERFGGTRIVPTDLYTSQVMLIVIRAVGRGLNFYFFKCRELNRWTCSTPHRRHDAFAQDAAACAARHAQRLHQAAIRIGTVASRRHRERCGSKNRSLHAHKKSRQTCPAAKNCWRTS